MCTTGFNMKSMTMIYGDLSDVNLVIKIHTDKTVVKCEQIAFRQHMIQQL